jgi:uncharacterized protein YecT (DUF1311 family)
MRLAFLALATLLAGPAVAADCDDTTNQLALNQCADAEFHAADTALNAAYQQIVGRLKDSPTALERLRAAQRAWVDFRDKECAFAASAAEQGSIHPLIITSCRTDLTKQRTEQLGRYVHCAEGDIGCPVPPAGLP